MFFSLYKYDLHPRTQRKYKWFTFLCEFFIKAPFVFPNPLTRDLKMPIQIERKYFSFLFLLFILFLF